MMLYFTSTYSSINPSYNHHQIFTVEVGFTTLSIYNIAGQKVRGLVSEFLTAGWHTVVWDGKDDRGAPVSAGIYFARLTCSGRAATGKMVMVK